MGGMLNNGMNMNNMNNGMNLNQFGHIGGIQNNLIGNLGNNQGTGQMPMNQ
jgi:hypothetical protein|tara:strand:+ start:1524 stop:1676 length:153 start_codon:yes stop_codon:yes gene_type:complete